MLSNIDQTFKVIEGFLDQIFLNCQKATIVKKKSVANSVILANGQTFIGNQLLQ